MINDLVHRLQASKKKSDSEWFRNGRAYGEKWARNHATYDELLRAVAVREDEDHPWELIEEGPYSPADILYFAINGDEDRDRSDARDFWVQTIEETTEPLQQPEFLRGFVDGAVDVLESVQAQL